MKKALKYILLILLGVLFIWTLWFLYQKSVTNWEKQAISTQLFNQIETWAKEVKHVLHTTAGARMESEWAKRPECKEAIMGASYSVASTSIPEVV